MLRKVSRWLTVLAVAGPALLSLGCGQSQKPAFPVRTQVLLDGKAIPGAFVVFHPVAKAEEGDKTPRPSGVVDASGNLQLTTYKSEDGAPAGDYVVTVEYRGPVPKSDEINPLKLPNLLPAKYTDPQASPLRVKINEGPNELPPLKVTRS